MNILIMGPAGCGKGTMSDKIVAKYPIPHISTGDMLRDAVKQGTHLGTEAKNYMDAGKLVPDTLINAMVGERLSKSDCDNGFLMDGFPRTLVQAKAFDEVLVDHNKKVDLVINLTVNFDILAQRVTGRRLCKTCGAIYHIQNKPSKVEGICDVCGSTLIQRSDDTVEQLKVRLDEHARNTEPVLDYYREKGLVKDIDATQSMDKVFEDIIKALENH